MGLPESSGHDARGGGFLPQADLFRQLSRLRSGARRGLIIDPVLDYDHRSGHTSTGFADALLDDVRRRGITIDWLLETHIHADHLSAQAYLKEKLGVPTAIGAAAPQVQASFKAIYNLGSEFTPDGSQFDRLLREGESLAVGGLEVEVMATPGHTPACISYRIGDCLFHGDTLFMPDYGTARCDFPGGDAATLYRSIRRILSLPPETRLFNCHDYGPNGRAFAWETTVAAQRRENIHIKDGIDEAAFVAMRRARDKALEAPVLILPALQVNIRGGRLPAPESNGTVYLKIPLNRI
jgi:glyoxylase-like metal-dependent hydrolase (beta-lactamase superfamily II)